MRIDDTQNMNIRQPNSSKAVDAGDLTGRSRNTSGAGPAAAIDHAGSTVHSGLLALALAGGDSATSNRVDELRHAIQGGTYQWDLQSVSHAMVSAAFNFD